MRDEASIRNILAIKDHSEETRKMLRVLENKINTIDTLTNKITLLEDQIRSLQVKIYSGGTTSGNIN